VGRWEPPGRGIPRIRFYLASWGVPSSVCLGLACKDLIDRSSVARCYMRLLNHWLPILYYETYGLILMLD
jgi:hypothetical protein